MQRIIIFLLLNILFLLFGCSSLDHQDSTDVFVTNQIIDNQAPSQIISDIPVETKTPSPSPVVLPSSTAYTVLSRVDAKTLVLEKLNSNENCNLPCWWGIIPGKTSKDEATSYLNQFGNLKHIDNSRNYFAFNDVIDPPGIYFHIVYSYNQGIVEAVTIITEQRNEPYKTPTEVSRLEYLSLMEKYRLATILQTQGEPDQIWIRSFSPSPNWFDTQTLLIYSDKGTAILYSSESKASGGEPMNTVTCPNLSNITLMLFDPQTNSSLDMFLNFVQIEKFLPLEEAADLSISEFTDFFQFKECNSLLETPSDLWPSDYK